MLSISIYVLWWLSKRRNTTISLKLNVWSLYRKSNSIIALSTSTSCTIWNMQFSYLCFEIFKIILIVPLFAQNILICESCQVRLCSDPGVPHSVDFTCELGHLTCSRGLSGTNFCIFVNYVKPSSMWRNRPMLSGTPPESLTGFFGPVKEQIYVLGFTADPFCFLVNRKQCVQISMVNGFILAGPLRATNVYRAFFWTRYEWKPTETTGTDPERWMEI